MSDFSVSGSSYGSRRRALDSEELLFNLTICVQLGPTSFLLASQVLVLNNICSRSLWDKDS